MLEDHGPPQDHLALEDEQASEPEVNNIDMMPPPELRVSLSFPAVRPPIVFPNLFVGERQVRCLFDGESHAQGPRLYASCPLRHPVACRKYVFLHNFPSVAEAAVWLGAWQLGAVHHQSSDEHVPYTPTDGEIERARQELPPIL